MCSCAFHIQYLYSLKANSKQIVLVVLERRRQQVLQQLKITIRQTKVILQSVQN